MYIMIHTSTFIKHLLITISDEAQHDSNILKPPKREQNCTFRYRIVTHLKSNIFEHSFPYHFLEKGYPSCPALDLFECVNSFNSGRSFSSWSRSSRSLADTRSEAQRDRARRMGELPEFLVWSSGVHPDPRNHVTWTVDGMISNIFGKFKPDQT